MLVGTATTPDRVASDHPMTEYFRPGGKYVWSTGRDQGEGTYAILKDLLWIESEGHRRQRAVYEDFGGVIFLSYDVVGRAVIGKHSLVTTAAPEGVVLTGEQLRTLLSDTNTTLREVRYRTGVSDFPSELLRSNGVYSIWRGRSGSEGTYSIEGDAMCVAGPDIARLCRRFLRQRDNTYLLINTSDNSQTLVDLLQRG